MLPLSCSSSKLEAVVAALSILSSHSIVTVSSAIRGIVDLDLFKLAIVLQKDKQIQDFGLTSGIRASRGTLSKKNHKNHKKITFRSRKMSQPAIDDFSQHLSDDEASYHEDASDNDTTTNKPKQQQQLIPTTTTILNIKLLILKKEEYDIWAMEMEHYL
ncbi:hypothetical protein Tco_0996104 [Tanacetum coccineum]